MIEVIKVEDCVENIGDYDVPIYKAVIIPKGATNGDVMKAMFPDINFCDMAFTVHATTKVISDGVQGSICYDFWKAWWNAPYKAESEVQDADSN